MNWQEESAVYKCQFFKFQHYDWSFKLVGTARQFMVVLCEVLLFAVLLILFQVFNEGQPEIRE